MKNLWMKTEEKHGMRCRCGKEAGMNPITTYCSWGDSHPAAATRLNTCLCVWLVNYQQKMRQKKKGSLCKLANINLEQDCSFYSTLKWFTQHYCDSFFFFHFKSFKQKRKLAVISFFSCFCILFSLFLNCNREMARLMILVWPISKQKSIGCHRELKKTKQPSLNLNPELQ